jgi:hypothetical protein
MGRKFILLGMFLAFIDIPLFVFAIIGLESEWFAAIVEPLICNSEEDLRIVTGFKGAVSASCEVGEKSRTVTGTIMMGLVGLFIGSFVMSMIFTFMGRRQLGKQQTQYDGDNMLNPFKLHNDEPAVIAVGDEKPKRGVMPTESATIIQTMLNAFGMDMEHYQQQTLTERLQQLEDARSQGLITQEEYDRVRTSIIDKLDD